LETFSHKRDATAFRDAVIRPTSEGNLSAESEKWGGKTPGLNWVIYWKMSCLFGEHSSSLAALMVVRHFDTSNVRTYIVIGNTLTTW